MQNPTAEEGSLIKREWWKVWDKGYIPPLQHIIQSYDTAFLKKESADYSAITTWGVFYPDEDSPANLILLDAFKERLEFPELRKEALEQYRYWQPETVLIESKASGMPLTFELRKMGIPVINYTPSKGNDKHARVNAVSRSLSRELFGRRTKSSQKRLLKNVHHFRMEIMTIWWTVQHKR